MGISRIAHDIKGPSHASSDPIHPMQVVMAEAGFVRMEEPVLWLHLLEVRQMFLGGQR